MCTARSVSAFKNFTDAISMPVTIVCGLRLQHRVHEHERDRDHEAERRAVHADRDARRQQLRLVGEIGVRHGRERLDEADDRAEQARERRHVGERGEVGRALLELRHDLDQALLHRELDVVAAPHGSLARQSHAQDLRDRGAVLAGDVSRALEVTFHDQRLELLPALPVLVDHERERHVALDRDRGSDRQDQQDRIHEEPAVREELYDRVDDVHA